MLVIPALRVGGRRNVSWVSLGYKSRPPSRNKEERCGWGRETRRGELASGRAELSHFISSRAGVQGGLHMLGLSYADESTLGTQAFCVSWGLFQSIAHKLALFFIMLHRMALFFITVDSI